MKFLLLQLSIAVAVAGASILPDGDLPPSPIHEGSIHWGEIERYLANNGTINHASKDFGCPSGDVRPNKYGCYKGWCWSYCGNIAGSDWCYTTATGNSDDGNYVTCHDQGDCCPTWSCGGSCG